MSYIIPAGVLPPPSMPLTERIGSNERTNSARPPDRRPGNCDRDPSGAAEDEAGRAGQAPLPRGGGDGNPAARTPQGSAARHPEELGGPGRLAGARGHPEGKGPASGPQLQA